MRRPAGSGRRAIAQLDAWLSAADPAPPHAPYELLILLETLRDTASHLPFGVLWPLWRTALVGAVQLSTQLDEPVGSSATEDQRLVIRGELPWEIGLLFADVQGAETLRRSGQRVLRQQLLEHTDTDGTPEAELLERLAFWLAPLTRSAQWARRCGVDLWDTGSARRFRALTKMSSPLCGADGRLALSNGFVESRRSLLESALVQGGWNEREVPLGPIRAVARPDVATNRRLKKSDVLPVMQSDWARVGCLRSDWSPEADRLVVAHHEALPQIELAACGRSLISGTWEMKLQIAGEPVALGDEWSCVCWNSDEDADYLELQMPLDDGLRLERQLLLSRTGHFAVLAEIVAGAGSERVDSCSRLPLVAGVGAEADVATRECRLAGNGLRARCFPLALPQDRVQGTAGALEAHSNLLELRQAAVGGLYAPLVIDWHPGRRRVEAQWRTLTVSEDGRTLKSDEAAGHRLRLGRHQLLVYRSLVRSDEHRAVLGHHTLHETVIGQFDGKGDVTPILMVE